MVRKLIYFLLFIVLFFVFFVLTFPVDRVLGYYLTRNSVKYEKIEGNLLKAEIYGITYKNFHVERLILKLVPFRLLITDKKSIRISITPDKKVKIKTKNLSLENYQIKPVVYGKADTDLSIVLGNKYIQTSGSINLFIKNLTMFSIKNTKVKAILEKEEKGSKVLADISGSTVSGRFKGKIIIPAYNIMKTRLKGKFKGKLFGSEVDQKIDIVLYKFMR